MLDAFEAIQGKFRHIRSLTRRQKDHLKRFHGGNDMSNGKTSQILYIILQFVIELLERKSVELK